MNLRLFLLTAGIYLSLACLIYFLNSSSKDVTVAANIYPRVVEVDQPINFKDSTERAGSILWEFGNGDKSYKSSGSYKYKKEGRYLVRLIINKIKRNTFSITVRKTEIAAPQIQPLSIFGNRVGIVGQEIHFKLLGPKVDWSEWYFGKSGKVESRDQETFHTFSEVGEYKIKVLTNLNPQIALYHNIKIIPQYKTTEIVSLKKQEPKSTGSSPDKLLMAFQEIANGGNLSSIYNQIVKLYLCSNLHVKVLVNGKSTIDLYSYCQSLQLGHEVKIDQVTPEIDPKSGCAGKIIVQQH